MKTRGCRFFSVALGLWLLVQAGPAVAVESRRGFYVGVELGFANAADLNSTVSGINHPTRCDQLLREVDPANVVGLDDPACQVGGAQPLLINSFDLGTGFLGAVSAGYALDRLRVEFEYLNRSHGGDSRPFGVPGGNAALQSKDSEWSLIDPPSERVSEFRAHQFFVNAYYDFVNRSRWTPYLGTGVGSHQSALRKPLCAQDACPGLPGRSTAGRRRDGQLS